MDRKNFFIAGLSLASVILFCAMVIMESNRQARAEVTVISSRESAVLTAASVRAGPQQEVLVLVDRTTHIMRVYLFQNNGRLQELSGSPLNLGTAMNVNPVGAMKKGR